MLSADGVKVTDEEYMSVVGYAFRAGSAVLDAPRVEYINEYIKKTMEKMVESTLSVTEEVRRREGGKRRPDKSHQ